MGSEEARDIAAKAADFVSFAVPFAEACISLKRGADLGVSVTLNPTEVRALIEALRLLRVPRGD